MRKSLFIIAALLSSAFAHAHSYQAGEVQIGHPWARATPGMSQNGAAYLTLENKGKAADRLMSASSPAADKVELHTHLNENGVMKMRQVESVTVEAGSSVAFKPGSYHIMLIGLHSPLKAGQRIPLTLVFEKSGQATVEVQVDVVNTEATHTMPMKH